MYTHKRPMKLLCKISCPPNMVLNHTVSILGLEIPTDCKDISWDMIWVFVTHHQPHAMIPFTLRWAMIRRVSLAIFIGSRIAEFIPSSVWGWRGGEWLPLMLAHVFDSRWVLNGQLVVCVVGILPKVLKETLNHWLIFCWSCFFGHYLGNPF